MYPHLSRSALVFLAFGFLGCRETDLPGPLPQPGDPQTMDLGDMGPLGDMGMGQMPSFVRGDEKRILLRGRVVTPEQVLSPGEVLLVSERIACVAPSCSDHKEAQGATTINTAGILFPGLVDAHNHTQYNYLPPWKPMPQRLFQNRGQWAALDDYKAHTKSVNDNEGMYGCQQVKYGEVRALIGGTTTIQGTGNTNRRCYRTLVHNAEYGNELGPDRMRTNIPGIASVNAADATTIATGMADGSINAYVIHLAEGIDETSRKEFDLLVDKGLLHQATVLVHGTALSPVEFAKLGQAGGKLVWSPQSNLQLYGKTTDIRAALAASVQVALAPDWTPSGSAHLLAELKVASQISKTELGGLLTPQKLVSMVTSVPAEILGLDSVVGRIKEGLLGDLLVIADPGGDVYEALLAARLSDIRLVVVSGRLRYGDPQVMDAVLQNRCEAMQMCGRDKKICIPDNNTGVDTLNEDWAMIFSQVSSFYASPYPLSVCGP